jgi:hypothetical protein
MKIKDESFEESLGPEERALLKRALSEIAIPPAPAHVALLTPENRKRGEELLAYFREEGSKEQKKVE